MLTNPRVFDEGWLPRDLPSRDGETNALASALRPATNGRDPGPVLVSGPPGTGKTATTRWVLDQLDTNTDTATAYVDGWDAHRGYQIYASILQSLGRAGVVNTNTPHSAFREQIRTAHDGELVIVIDEAEQVDDPHVLHDLDAMPGVGIVLIVNDADRFQTRLRTKPPHLELGNHIEYAAYSQQELREIMRPRLERGLRDDVDVEQVAVSLSREAKGNARVAIQSVPEAVDWVRGRDGVDKLTPRAIAVGAENARWTIRQKARSRLPRHARIVLEIVEDVYDADAVPVGVSMGDIYAEYENRTEDEARSKRRVGDYLSKLVSYNQLRTKGERRGTRYLPVGGFSDKQVVS